MPSITHNRMRLAHDRRAGAGSGDEARRRIVQQRVGSHRALRRWRGRAAQRRGRTVAPEPDLPRLNAARLAQAVPRSRPTCSRARTRRSWPVLLTRARRPAHRVRRFIERSCSRLGFRETSPRAGAEGLTEAGAAPGALATLVDRRLLASRSASTCGASTDARLACAVVARASACATSARRAQGRGRTRSAARA